jgi:putative oxygen-independent coproporphyrinogen III oxidase
VRSVYVHAPFCVRRCFYCDFAVQVRREGDVEAWSEALAGELRGVGAEGVFELAWPLDTLYVGGGTPSLLGPAAMDALAGVLGAERVRGDGLEWTAEANPESLTGEVATAWKAAGLNRLSLGVQSFDRDVLRWMGRMHGPEGAVEAVDVARAAGFENLSIDLIFGVPGRLGRSWRDDLERALTLDVGHVSLYGLSVERGTPLGRAVAAGSEAPVDEEQYRAEYLTAAQLLTGAGYLHYELSNFARPGLESRHNAAYWDGTPYLGLGNGAHSYAHPLRRWNVRDWSEYATRAAAGTIPEAEREEVDAAAVRLERLWLGLRTRTGLDLDGLPPAAVDVAGRWVDAGWARASEGRLRLTAEGWLLLDRLAVELDLAATG